jgi:hypothetical protein
MVTVTMETLMERRMAKNTRRKSPKRRRMVRSLREKTRNPKMPKERKRTARSPRIPTARIRRKTQTLRKLLMTKVGMTPRTPKLLLPTQREELRREARAIRP